MIYGHPEKHRLLAYYHALKAEHEGALASYHWQASVEPINHEPMPVRPAALEVFERGNYREFRRLAGLEDCEDEPGVTTQ